MNLLEGHTFREIFYDVFLPLLNEIGLLWQTNTISPAHEHYLSVHIKQKILLNIEKLQNLEPKPNTKTFVLYLLHFTKLKVFLLLAPPAVYRHIFYHKQK